MKYIIIVFLITSTSVFSQNAEFNADINTLKESLKDGFEDLQELALEMRWVINGKKLSYGTETVYIKPNRFKVDTILFKKNASSKWDTIICNIYKANKYNLVFNICCSNFYVSDLSQPKKRFERKKSIVNFKTIGNKSSKKYIGIIENAGIIIEKENMTYQLFHTCASAMSSNIYNVSINEVKVCDNYEDSMNLSCLFTNNNKEVSRTINYKKIKELISFFYLPLSEESLNVNFNVETEEFKLMTN